MSAGAYFVLGNEISILIYSSTNFILEKYPMAASLYKPNMVLYYNIRGNISPTQSWDPEFKVPVRMISSKEFDKIVKSPIIFPHDTKPAILVSKCKSSKRCSAEWFKREALFINGKLKEFTTARQPFNLQQAIKNIDDSM